MKRILSAILVVGLTGTVLLAQGDAIEIKLARPKAGDSARFTKHKKNKFNLDIGVDANDQSVDEKHVYVYVETILEKPDPKKKATKLTRTYETAELSNGGEDAPRSFAKKTVTIEKKNGAYTFTVDGKSLLGDEEARLKRDFADEPDNSLEEDLLPGRAVKLNEAWKVDAGKIFNENRWDMPPFSIDGEKSKGSAKLTKVFDRDGHKYGTIEFTAECSVKTMKFGPYTGKMDDGSRMTFKGTIDLCIDGTSPLGSAKTSLEVDLTTNLPSDGTITVKGGVEVETKAEKVK